MLHAITQHFIDNGTNAAILTPLEGIGGITINTTQRAASQAHKDSGQTNG
jgi:hypothetical protein